MPLGFDKDENQYILVIELHFSQFFEVFHLIWNHVLSDSLGA